MHTIIAIALVSAAQALLQCSDYCKLIFYNQPVKWRPDCNCFDMKKEKPQMDLALGDMPNLLYNVDASSIYYEPAETYRLSFQDQPFYLVNPTGPTISKESLPDSPRGEEEVSRTVTKNYKRAHVHKIDIEAEELPLYLDIDIHNAASQAKSTSQFTLKTKVEDFRRTENYLMKCIDLNFVIISRTYGDSNENIGKFNSNNMQQYSDMSDSDLMAELKENCDLPTGIIEQSLQEIKNNSPMKNKSTKKLQQNITQDVNTYETRQNNFIKSSVGIITDAPFVKRTIANYTNAGDWDYINHTTFFPENKTNTYENKNILPLVEKAAYDLSHTNIEEIFNNDQDDLMTTISYENFRTNETNYNRSSKYNSDYQERTALQEDFTKNSAINLFTTDSSTVLSLKETEKGITLADWELTTENVPIIDAHLQSLSQYSSKLNNENKDWLNLDMITTTKTLTENRSYESDLKSPYISKSNFADKVTNKSIPTESVTDSITENSVITTRFNRIQYLEGEYPIPKIISKELSNNTINSNVDGNETIPNLDFISFNTSQTFDDITSEYTTASNGGEIIDVVDKNMQVFSSNELEVNGEIFFQYGDSKIPARFVQNSLGKINIAIDGASICDELFKREEKKSPLITSLCNCVQSRNCSHT